MSMRRASANQQRREFVTSIAVGDVVESTVCQRGPNCLLVSVRGVSVVVYRQELASKHPPPDPTTDTEDGAHASVKVVRVDKEKLKVTGRIRQAGTHPLENGTITAGMISVGYITAFKAFGAFMTLPQGVTGLLHETEIFSRKRGSYYPSLKTVFSINQQVEVLVHSFDAVTNRIELKLPNGPSFR